MSTTLFGWAIVYVPDVEEALAFYEKAFGLERLYVDEHATFGQLDTGPTGLAFASNDRAERELGRPFRRGSADETPSNFEVCLVVDDPVAAYRHAVASGCAPIAEPEPKPHGQTAGFVRDPFGTLVELASPLG